LLVLYIPQQHNKLRPGFPRGFFVFMAMTMPKRDTSLLLCAIIVSLIFFMAFHWLF
jgi:hypothetical protein